MSVEAVVITKWKKDQRDRNVPEKLDEVIHHTVGNSWSDITGQPAPLISGKITGNLKNLAVFRMRIADATWAAYQGSPQLGWIYWSQVDADGNVIGGNADDVLTAGEFSVLVNWLTSNDFDASSLLVTDTRQELLDKLIPVFNQ